MEGAVEGAVRVVGAVGVQVGRVGVVWRWWGFGRWGAGGLRTGGFGSEGDGLPGRAGAGTVPPLGAG